jgi:hypothetical protein
VKILKSHNSNAKGIKEKESQKEYFTKSSARAGIGYEAQTGIFLSSLYRVRKA